MITNRKRYERKRSQRYALEKAQIEALIKKTQTTYTEDTW